MKSILKIFGIITLLAFAGCNNKAEFFQSGPMKIMPEDICLKDPSHSSCGGGLVSSEPPPECTDASDPKCNVCMANPSSHECVCRENPKDPLCSNDICRENPLAPACVSEPVAVKPSVATILLTLSQIEPNAAQLIAINIVKVVSPKKNPKILLLEDSNLNGEDPQDVQYVRSLLASYDVTFKKIAKPGLMASEVQGYDVLWIINPGHPLQDSQTVETIKSLKISIVLQGDDMGRFNGAEPLTGLKYVGNGTSVDCGGKSFRFDNLAAYEYEVSMLENFIQGIRLDTFFSKYGNDIDKTIAMPGVKVLATAKAPPGTCGGYEVPAIVVKEIQ